MKLILFSILCLSYSYNLAANERLLSLSNVDAVAFGFLNLSNKEGSSGVDLVSPALGLQLVKPLTPKLRLNTVFDVAAGYNYFIFKEGESGEFDWERFVDEVKLEYSLSPKSVLALGKQRFKADHLQNPLPLGIDPKSREKNVFPSYAATWTVTDEATGTSAQLYVGESLDGESDLDLRAEGMLYGAKLRLPITESMALHASGLHTELPKSDDYHIVNAGLSYSTPSKKIRTFLGASQFENSPFHSPSADRNYEGVVECKITDKTSVGFVGICTPDEGETVFTYVERKMGRYTIKAFVGYDFYDDDFSAKTGAEEGVRVGASVDLLYFIKNPWAENTK